MTASDASSPLKVVVFDRSPEDARLLGELLGSLPLRVEVQVAVTEHATDIAGLLAQGAELLFVDLGPADALYDGVDLVRSLLDEGSRTHVIFTGRQQAAHRRVYLADHLWFLPKPVDGLELQDAMEKALRVIDADRAQALVLRAGRLDVVVRPHKVSYVESKLRVLRVHEEGRVVEVYGNLADMAERLPRHFVRCHKSYVVNLDYVRSIARDEMELVGGETIPVSQRRRTATRNALYEHFATLARSGTFVPARTKEPAPDRQESP